MQNFCQSRIINKLPPSLRSVHKGTVDKIEVLPKAQPSPDEDTSSDDSQPANCVVHLSNGETLPARAVIVACSNLNPVIPSWASEAYHKERENLQGPSHGRDESHSFETSVKTISDWKDLISSGAFDPGHVAPFKGKNVAIVGGGMNAALLALRAASRGAARVTLLARRPLVRQAFDCDVGWWGNKYLNAFWQDSNPENRMKACRQARMQASLSPEVWDALVEAAASGRITVVEGQQVESMNKNCEEDRGGWNLMIQPTPGLSTSAAVPQQGTAFQQATVKATAEGSSSPKKAFEQLSLEDESETTEDPLSSSIFAHFVWLACGSAFNTSHHSILSSLEQSHPTRLVAGYPVIDPGSCVWPGAPIYLLGRGAMLAVGPCAGDLAGMRLGAERIVKSLKKLDYAGTTEWETAAETLAPQLQLAAASLEKITTNNGICRAPQTIVLENYLALEEEGLMCYERRIKPHVARPVHLVDVSDLPAALPRHEIHKFSFSEDDFEICITLTLPEAVPIASVRSMITEKSLEVWAIGIEGSYRLHVPRLYGRVIPPKCQVKVNEKKKKVYVMLYKEKDAEWRFLKGI